MSYEVKTDIFEGPLALLVELTKLNLIDVFILELVELTGFYLDQIKDSDVHLDQLAEPLPLLGNLVAIKARGLLPKPVVSEEDEEAPVSLEELKRRLQEYEQFKTVAQLLSELRVLQQQYFARNLEKPELSDEAKKKELSRFDVGITDLMQAFSSVLDRATVAVYEVKAESWTVERKIKDLRLALTVKRRIRFLEVFTADKTRLELVVTFLALLELIRQRIARALQEDQFGDIMIAYLPPEEESDVSSVERSGKE